MMVLPVIAMSLYRDTVTMRTKDPGFPAEQYLGARIAMDRSDAADGDTTFATRYHAALRELEERLEQDPAIAAVTYAERLPLMYHPHRRVEVEGGGAALSAREVEAFGDPAVEGYRVSSSYVALDYFRTLAAAPTEGRVFLSGDQARDARTVIVNESFVRCHPRRGGGLSVSSGEVLDGAVSETGERRPPSEGQEARPERRPPEPSPSGVSGPAVGRVVKRLLRRPEAAVGLVTITVIAVTTLKSATFLTSGDSRRDLLLAPAMLVLLAIGQTVVIISRNVDLSVGSILGLTAYATGRVFVEYPSLPWPVVLVLAMVVGAVLGLVNGVLVAYGKVPALVITLGTL
jgi:hypothetical protein